MTLIIRALSLIGRVPNCRLGWSQFESGRARHILLISYVTYISYLVTYCLFLVYINDYTGLLLV